jgi:branched-chain amino acid transport system substrate-binding protein
VKGRTIALVCLASITASGCARTEDPIRVGAVYPLSGSQAEGGGLDEFRGAELAAALVNEDGGVGGRPIELVPIDVPGADAAPGAIGSLADRGVDLVLGSYGSTISQPAAEGAALRDMLFWETGAVGEMTGTGAGELVFRVSPTGGTLGHAAVAFIADELSPMLHRDARSLRFAVANVDDVYGRSVARGALDEIGHRGLTLAGTFPYDPYDADLKTLARTIARSDPDVLFVSAYLEDGVALRRETVRQGLDLVASIGTSSSYCHPQFGEALGEDALGLFASDKPDSGSLNTEGLTKEARDLLGRASTSFLDRYGEEMSAPALSGFSAAWALFHDVIPRASSPRAEAVARVARGIRIPRGALPNGSGLSFAAPGSPDAGANLRAASVIWEWVGVGQRAVVWPPQFATTSIRPIDIAP